MAHLVLHLSHALVTFWRFRGRGTPGESASPLMCASSASDVMCSIFHRCSRIGMKRITWEKFPMRLEMAEEAEVSKASTIMTKH